MIKNDYIVNGEQPASPIFDDCVSTHHQEIHHGLTKRETFAMAAMQGILSHSFGRGMPEELAVTALKNADALLKELEK